MEAKYRPIATLTDTDQGAVNTIVAITMIVTTILFSSIRYVIGRQRSQRMDTDDFVYGVALILAIATSLISQQIVPYGLGQHEDALSPEKLDVFYRLHYATHFLGVLSMTAAKGSVALMFHRIIPTQAPITMKLLMPIIFTYALISLFLVAFQCQLPQPWVLKPLSCTTHGSVHYATAALNMITDAIVAFWIIRPVWNLQMARSARIVVISLLMVRLVVCVCDAVKIVFIRRALHSVDATWAFLAWAVMDQVVVHASLNHASLPRIHVFLRNLQTGLAISRVAANDSVHTKAQADNSNESYTDRHREKKADSSVTPLRSDNMMARSGFFNPFRTNGGRKVISISEDDHSSETHLRLQPEQGTEMSTIVTSGDDQSTSSSGNPKVGERERAEGGSGVYGFGIDRNVGGHVPLGHIKIEQTVEIKTERGP